MRQEIRGFTLIAVALVFAAGAHAAVPEWVHQAAEKPLGTLDPEIKAVVLLDEVKYTIPGGEDILERYRRVVRIVRKEGREEGELSVWTGHQGKVLSVHAWSIENPDGNTSSKRKILPKGLPTLTSFTMTSVCARRKRRQLTRARWLPSSTRYAGGCG